MEVKKYRLYLVSLKDIDMEDFLVAADNIKKATMAALTIVMDYCKRYGCSDDSDISVEDVLTLTDPADTAYVMYALASGGVVVADEVLNA